MNKNKPIKIDSRSPIQRHLATRLTEVEKRIDSVHKNAYKPFSQMSPKTQQRLNNLHEEHSYLTKELRKVKGQ